jgi:hypothetical protein
MGDSCPVDKAFPAHWLSNRQESGAGITALPVTDAAKTKPKNRERTRQNIKYKEII